MQLIVLGMHRSGTSVITRILNLMGAYFGPEGVALGANEENPKGFWERRDVLELDEALLEAGGAEWNRIAEFTLEKIPKDALSEFRGAARKLVLELDAHRPWVVKEPRMCLLVPVWRDLLEVPVCVYVDRHPIQVAQSLNRRNGFPIAFGLALWERNTLDAIRAASDLPTVSVMHEDLMRDPVFTTRTLFEQLAQVGVQGLRLPSEREILAFVDPKLFRQTGGTDLEAKYISVHQKALADAIESDFPRLLANSGELAMSDGGQANLLAYQHHIELERALGEEKTANEEIRIELADRTEHLRATERALAECTDLLQQREQDFADQAERLHHYRDVCDQLRRDYKAAKTSARWKIGTRLVRTVEVLLRDKPRLVMGEIAATLKPPTDWADTQAAAARSGAQIDSPDVACIREWVRLLDADFRPLLKSKRWTIGNGVVRTINVGTGRHKVAPASDLLRFLDQVYIARGFRSLYRRDIPPSNLPIE